MAKRPTLSDITTGHGTTTKLNANFDAIEQAFDNTLSRDGSSPNAMQSDLDMNSNQILNLPDATTSSEPLTLRQYLAGATGTVNGFRKESQIATAGQTVFTATTVQWVPGVDNLVVFLDGVMQGSGNYSINTSTQITFSVGVPLNTRVDFLVMNIAGTIASTTTDAGLVTYQPAGTANVTNVESKLREFVSVKDFGAVGDGVTDDTAAIQAAINAATGSLVFPFATYKCDSRVTATKSNLKIIGNESTIDCTATTAGGFSGAFLWLTGDNNTIDGLKINAPVVPVDSTNYLEGRIIRFIGDNNIIKNCYLSGGNGGGVRIQGDNNLIENNEFYQVNNRNGGGDYGSVEIRSGFGNRIIRNKITDFFYAGISAYGDDGAGSIITGDITIDSNTIEGSATRTYTMGVFLLQGANKNITITNNRISEIGNEGVVIFNDNLSFSENCLVRGNIFENVDYSGIFINSNSGSDAAKSCIISDNVIKFTPAFAGSCFGIVLENASQCRISNNTIEGPSSASYGVGIVIQLGTNFENVVSGNIIRRTLTAISFSGTRSKLNDNISYEAGATGIIFAGCESSSITNNVVVGAVTGFNGTSSNYTSFLGNLASGCTTDFTATGVVRNFFGTSQSAEGATTNFVNGTLSGGTANVTFSNISAGDVFSVCPLKEGGTVGNFGALYVAYQDSSANLLTIKSTNASDDRPFIVVKIGNAQVAS